MDGLAIPFRLFELMLNQASLKPLFEHYRPWGKLDAGTWTYLMEETYYHPTLLHFIKAERRELKVDKLADLFISQKSLRRKRDAAKCWRSYIWRRKRSRFLMTENIGKALHAQASACAPARANGVALCSLMLFTHVCAPPFVHTCARQSGTWWTTPARRG